MNNTLIRLMLAVLMAVGFVVVYNNKRTKVQKSGYTIGIIQTASHPALDAVQRGFMEEIDSYADKKIDYVVHNGQGSVAAIHTIAQQFDAKQDIDGVFAIATPAAQTTLSVIHEKPVCLAAVSVSPTNRSLFSGKNVCGVSDSIDVGLEIDAMMGLLPHVQTVGVLFSTAETNSIAASRYMIQELEQRGLTGIEIGITSEADIEPAVTSAMRKVDVVLCPTDNMIANAISLVANVLEKAGKPLVISDNLLVHHGALMARGVDYYQCGKDAAKIMKRVLVEKVNPSDIGIQDAEAKHVFINERVCTQLGIVIPESIKHDVVLV